MKRSLILIAVLASLASLPAQAAPGPRCSTGVGGRTVVATGLPNGPQGCSYVSTGPATYTVATASGFRITIFDANGANPRSADGAVGAYAGRGIIRSAPGEIVQIAISVTTYVVNESPRRVQDGIITVEAPAP